MQLHGVLMMLRNRLGKCLGSSASNVIVHDINSSLVLPCDLDLDLLLGFNTAAFGVAAEPMSSMNCLLSMHAFM